MAMKQLVLATRNRHKVAEIQAMLRTAAECRSMADYPAVPDLVEHADTFSGNAASKAGQLARWLASRSEWNGGLVLADDSGLEVDALAGAPGVYSARFAADENSGGNATDTANNAKLLRLLDGVPAGRRSARFRCVLCVIETGRSRSVDVSQVDPGGQAEYFFEGVCEGSIGLEPRGSNGFGYDPLFVPDGQKRSFAELGDEVKNRISHRARAVEALRVWLNEASTRLPGG